MFSSHTTPFSLPCMLKSVTQLANGFFSPIMHCRAPLAQLFLFFKENNGVFCSQRFNFLIALPIKKKNPFQLFKWNFQTYKRMERVTRWTPRLPPLRSNPCAPFAVFNCCMWAWECVHFSHEPSEGTLEISWHVSPKHFSLFSYKTIGD